MKTIYLAGGGPKNTAIKVLSQHLENKGHRVTRDAQDPNGWDVTVRWGVSYHGNKPALNARVNRWDKMEHLGIFDEHGIPAPALRMNSDRIKQDDLPVLARKRHHQKGQDIIVCKSLAEAKRIEAQYQPDFFTPWIPTATEYRVWVINGRAIAVYEKVFKGEGEYTGFMRNHRFGFKFQNSENMLRDKDLVNPAIKSVKVLEMDFGAVDVLKGKDGKYYVLEVNSMPHIDSTERVSGIRLANEISRWAEEQ